MTYPEVSVTDAAYIAGFFDGEGCVDVVKRTTIQIRISQVETSILHWIRDTLGFGRVADYSDRVTASNTPKASVWVCHSRETVTRFFEVVLPYLRLKADQARLALKIANFMPAQRMAFHPDDLEILRDLACRLAELKGNASHKRRYK